MYVRQVQGEEAFFGVSGKLWRDSLVMYDRKTRSLWSQVNGKSIKGKLEGKTLTPYPSMLLTWGEWKAIYPKTKVFFKPRFNAAASTTGRKGQYEDYRLKPKRLGVFGSKNPDPRLPGKTLVYGMYASGENVAFPFEEVKRNGLANAMVGRLPVLIHVDGEPPTAIAFARKVDGRVLTFDPIVEERGIPLLRDRETKSVWLARVGLAVQGELKGKRLSLVDGRTVYWFVWAKFNPKTAIWEPEETPSDTPAEEPAKPAEE